MVLYLGEAVKIVASASDPESGAPLDPPPSSAFVDFWGPGVNRRTESPTISRVSMTYRTGTKDFVLVQNTAPMVDPRWIAGKWTYRVTMVGLFSNFEYATFTLKS